MIGDWTYYDFKKVVITALEIDDLEYVKLDCNYNTYDNMKQIVAWAEERGYHAEISSNKEIIKVWK